MTQFQKFSNAGFPIKLAIEETAYIKSNKKCFFESLTFHYEFGEIGVAQNVQKIHYSIKIILLKMYSKASQCKNNEAICQLGCLLWLVMECLWIHR